MNIRIKLSIFLTICLLINTFGLSAEPANGPLPRTDSVGSATEDILDTAAINKLVQKASDSFEINPDTALFYAERSIAFSRKINYEAGIADALLVAGHVNYFEGNPTAADHKFAQAIEIYNRLNDKIGLTQVYIAYGRMYNLFANYALAFKYLNKALLVNHQTHDELTLTDCYKNIGIGYFNQGNLSNALDYYYKALLIANKNHYQSLSADLYNDIGIVLQNMEAYPNALTYFNKALALYNKTKNVLPIAIINENVGELLLNEGRYDEAIRRLTDAISLAKKQQDKDGLSSVYADLGLCFASKHNAQRAISYLDTSLKVASKYKITYNEAYALAGFATVYNMEGNYAGALKYEKAAEQLAIKLGNLSVRANTALQLSKTMAALKHYQDAYRYLAEYNDLKKRLKDNETIEKLTFYNFELSYAAREQAIKEQRMLFEQRVKNQHFLNAIFVIVIIAMLIVSGIYYNAKRKQQRINAVLESKNVEITRQKSSMDEQAAKLHDLNALKDRLISILAHDLRAPLSTLRGLFNLLLDKTINIDELLQLVPEVLKNLEYTSDFLDTLLFWINCQMDNFERAVKQFTLLDAVGRELDHYQEQALAKHVRLSANIPADLTAFADPNSIRIVMRNLITNAIKFTPEHGSIHISAQANSENEVLISVKDTGMGMSVDRLNKLFKSKVDSKIGTKNESGTGLGLFLCKDLVEKCNGKIWVTSEEGAGTAFHFTIPMAGKLVPEPVS
jgi:signal transduction histidine kinase